MLRKYYDFLRKKLWIRRVIRHPISISFSYLLLILGTCAFGSKTVWKDYKLWQIPSLLNATLCSAASILSGLFVLRLISQVSIINFQRIKYSVIKKGLLTVTFTLLGLSLLIVSIIVPSHDYLSDLARLCQGPKEIMYEADSLLTKIKSMEKYKDLPILVLYKKVIDFKENSDSWENAAFETFILTLHPYINHSDFKIRSIATLLAAQSFDCLGDFDTAKNYYWSIANDLRCSRYIRNEAFMGLGSISARSNDMQTAYYLWYKAVLLVPSSSVFENIALYHQTNKQYAIAQHFYDESDRALEI
jgi:hypothetical protein